MDDGTELDIVSGDAYEIPSGHDAWVVGDQPFDTVEFTERPDLRCPPEAEDERTLATILFTDIVDSTATLGRLGDAMWQRLLLEHNDRSRAELDRYRGREVVRRPATASWRCSMRLHGRCAARRRSRRPSARSGSRSGPVCTRVRSTIAGGNARGVAVHAASRIASLAGPGEVLVSGTTRDLLDGSGLRFTDRGEHELKGLEGPRRVFALER